MAIAAVTAFNVNFVTQSKGLSAIGLANVEMLAYGESGNSHYWCCGNSGTCAGGPNYVIHGQFRCTPC